jgi:hypothetical protein
MKKKYTVPQMEVVETGATLLQTTSPTTTSIPMKSGEENQITDETKIW